MTGRQVMDGGDDWVAGDDWVGDDWVAGDDWAGDEWVACDDWVASGDWAAGDGRQVIAWRQVMST